MLLTAMIIGAAFIGMAALVYGVAMLFRSEGDSAVEDRLSMLAGGQPGRKGDSDGPQLLLNTIDEGGGVIGEWLSRNFHLGRVIEQADANLSVSNFIGISLALAFVGGVTCFVTPVPKAVAPLAALFAGALPTMWLYFKRKRRLGKFAAQLPEALELIARALRAGHSLAAGINLVAEEMHEPIRKEFARCYDEQNLGIPLDEALEGMTERVPNLDFRFFATAVILQRQTGGDLAEILDKIGHLVRERFKILGQVQALTGEGRLSGVVLLALPPVLFFVLYYLNPEYCMTLFRDPMGQQMLVGAIIMQLLGAVVIRKIVTIRV